MAATRLIYRQFARAVWLHTHEMESRQTKFYLAKLTHNYHSTFRCELQTLPVGFPEKAKCHRIGMAQALVTAPVEQFT